ncbi:MAG: hypothetical protein IKF78_09970 [Atopobiaceae bacterium]|nr:hypothetical protein [Atopobiaceae bacterium]
MSASIPPPHNAILEATETAQTFAKVGIYADQRIGEILRELPTRQGRRTDTTLSTTQDEVTKRQAMAESGISKSQAYDLQAMAANPEVVETVIAKAKERQGERTDIVQTFAEGSSGRARDKAGARHHPPT